MSLRTEPSAFIFRIRSFSVLFQLPPLAATPSPGDQSGAATRGSNPDVPVALGTDWKMAEERTKGQKRSRGLILQSFS